MACSHILRAIYIGIYMANYRECVIYFSSLAMNQQRAIDRHHRRIRYGEETWKNFNDKELKFYLACFLTPFRCQPAAQVFESTLAIPLIPVNPAHTLQCRCEERQLQKWSVLATYEVLEGGYKQLQKTIIFDAPWYQLRVLTSVSNSRLGPFFQQAYTDYCYGTYDTAKTAPVEDRQFVILGRLMLLVDSLGIAQLFHRSNPAPKIMAEKIKQKLAVELPNTISIPDLSFTLAELFGYRKVKMASTTRKPRVVGSTFHRLYTFKRIAVQHPENGPLDDLVQYLGNATAAPNKRFHEVPSLKESAVYVNWIACNNISGNTHVPLLRKRMTMNGRLLLETAGPFNLPEPSGYVRVPLPNVLPPEGPIVDDADCEARRAYAAAALAAAYEDDEAGDNLVDEPIDVDISDNELSIPIVYHASVSDHELDYEPDEDDIAAMNNPEVPDANNANDNNVNNNVNNEIADDANDHEDNPNADDPMDA